MLKSKFIWGAVALLLPYASQLAATTLIYKSYSDLVSEADVVVAGRVSDIRSVYGQNKDIYSFITIDQVEVLGGNYQGSSITLRMKGGEVDNNQLRLQGSPDFDLDEEVVLFVKGNGREMVPFVGWTQGAFRVARDAKTGERVMQDNDHNRIVGFEGDTLLKDQVTEPEANIVTPRALAKARSKEEASPGESDNRFASARMRNAAVADAPTMTYGRFAANVKKSFAARRASSRVQAATATSVSTADVIEDSNPTDDAASSSLQLRSRGQAAPAGPAEPTLPKRAADEPVQDQ